MVSNQMSMGRAAGPGNILFLGSGSLKTCWGGLVLGPSRLQEVGVCY